MRVKRAAWHPRRVYQAVGLTRPTRPTLRAAVLAAAGKARCAAVEAAVRLAARRLRAEAGIGDERAPLFVREPEGEARVVALYLS